MRLTIIAILLLCIAAVSCKKGDLIEGRYNGELKLSLVPLPNTPSLDIYFDGKFVDTLAPSNMYTPFLFRADKEGLLEVRKSKSKEVILDTTIVIPRENSMELKFAYSEELGIKNWLGGSDIDKDSVKVQFHNIFPVEWVPDGMTIEAELFIQKDFYTGEFEPYGVPLLLPFERNKVYPVEFTLPAYMPDGNSMNVMLKCRNAVTKEPIIDLFDRDGQAVDIGFYAGRRIIISVGGRPFRGNFLFINEYIEM